MGVTNYGAAVGAGGTTGQVLAKASTIDYDTAWTTASSGATGYYRLFLFGIGTRN
jgi:hypothetical protein